MKMLITADWHIGKTIKNVNLYPYHKELLMKGLDAAITLTHPDVVVVAGDVFDTKEPDIMSINLYVGLIQMFLSHGIYVFLTCGNHDKKIILECVKDKDTNNHVLISEEYAGRIVKKKLYDEYGEVNFYLLPYISNLYDEEHEELFRGLTSFEILDRILSKEQIDFEKRNVFIGHQFVLRDKVENVEQKEAFNAFYFKEDQLKKFDVSIIGHEHERHEIGGNIFIPGAPYQNYYLDSPKKGVGLISLFSKGQKEYSFLEIVNLLYSFVVIRINLEEITYVKPKAQRRFVYVIVNNAKVVPKEIESTIRKYIPECCAVFGSRSSEMKGTSK